MSEVIHSLYKGIPVVTGFIDNKMEYLSFVRESDLGNVYICKVDNLINNKGSAFVRYKKDVIGHVTLSGIGRANVINREDSDDKSIHQGDEVLLQLEAEPIKMKKAKLTPFISIQGRYSVVTLGKRGVGASNKLSFETKQELVSLIKGRLGELDSETLTEKLFGSTYGVIIRTEAASLEGPEAGDKILDDIRECLSKLTDLLAKARTRTVYSCLLSTDNEDPAVHEENAVRYLKSLSDEECRIIQDDGIMGVSAKIDKLFMNRVWLNSGAFLIIEQLESFNAIDVNTGKAIEGKNIIEKVNFEAAHEIMRQIRLRNLTGMILIDFINLKNEESTDKLCRLIKDLARKDPVHTEFIDITGLGIVELTRNKNGKTIKDIIDNR